VQLQYLNCGCFGRDGIVAHKEAAEKLGAKVVAEEYCDPKGTDFTDPIQRIIETLIATMEGMEFMTPKGKMKFRKEDHQALQEMYAFQLLTKPDVEWAIPVCTRVLSMDDTAPPVMNKR